MSDDKKPRHFRLEITSHGSYPAPDIVRLRLLLKALSRRYGFRCTRAVLVPEEERPR